MKGVLYYAAMAGLALTVFARAAEPTGLYKQDLDRFQALHQQYPSLTSLFSIGQNDDGVEIYAMRISLTPEKSDPQKVGHLIVATHHGNEQKCPAMVASIAAELLRKYSSTELFRGNLAQTEWVIIPVLNVSGYNGDDRYEHGVDPNRDYPGICSHSAGGQLKSIRLLQDYLKTRAFTGSLTVHGYVGSLTYPWGIDVDNTRTQDDNLFSQITAKAAAINNYRYGTSTDVVYPAEGSYEDFVYWKYGMWSLLLELRSGDDQDIKDTTQAVLTYFDQLESSPSTHNQLTGHCNGRRLPDLHLE